MVATRNIYSSFSSRLKPEIIKAENLLKISFIAGIVTGYIGNGEFFGKVITAVALALLFLSVYANCSFMLNLPIAEDNPEKIKIFILDGVAILAAYIAGYIIAIYGF